MNKSVSLAAALLIAVLLFSLASCSTAEATATTASAPITLSKAEVGVETRGDIEPTAEPTNTPATSAEPTTPAQPTTPAEPTGTPDFENMDYEKYSNLTSEQQYEYFLTFSDPGAFLLWFNEQKELYDLAHPAIVVEPGETIDIGN